jgi:hypothetical protein
MSEHVENWDRRIVEFAIGVQGQPFEWGQTDCVSLVRRGLQVMFGEDVWKGHVGTWKTRRGALTVSGKTDYEGALLASGAVEVGHHYGTSGDVALGPKEDEHGMIQMGLLVPTRKVVTATPHVGVAIVDKLRLEEGTRFFRYGVNVE